MKLRKTILDGCYKAVSESQREMWRAIYLLEKRTRSLKPVPPFPKSQLNVQDRNVLPVDNTDAQKMLVIPVDTADFCRKVQLKTELQKLYGLLSSKERFQYVCILDAIDVVTTILDADSEDTNTKEEITTNE